MSPTPLCLAAWLCAAASAPLTSTEPSRGAAAASASAPEPTGQGRNAPPAQEASDATLASPGLEAAPVGGLGGSDVAPGLAFASAAPPQANAVARAPHNLWLESGLSLGVDVINDIPDLIFDVKGLRAGIVDRNRAAFELSWLPRLGYTFDFGLTLGLYGGVGFTGPSTPQLAIMLDRNGLSFQKQRGRDTGYALAVMGGTFLGLRGQLSGGRYLMPTIGVHWRGHQREGLHSKLMVDLRFDTGFRVRGNTYVAVGPSVRMAAFSWGGLSHSGMREVSFNLVMTVSQAVL